MEKRRFLGIAVVLLFLICIPDWAQPMEKKFPSKPIQVIIPAAPGDTDNLLRPFVEKMPEYLGQPVTMIYKPGAATALGSKFVAASKPDGYTLLGCPGSALLVPHTQKDAGYNLDSFAPVSCLVEGTLLFAVRDSAPWKDLQDLVADAKRRPNEITYSSSGTYGITHLAGEAFAKQAGIKLNYIPSQGSGPAVTATLGGHVDIASSALTPVFPHLKAGTMRVLAVFNKHRPKALPDSPTFAERGYPVVVPIYYGLLASRGTPTGVIEILAGATQKVIEKQGEFLNDRLNKLGAQLRFLGPAEYAAFLKDQDEFFERVLKGSK